MIELLTVLNNLGDDWIPADSVRPSADHPAQWILTFKPKPGPLSDVVRCSIRIPPTVGRIEVYVTGLHPAPRNGDRAVWTPVRYEEASQIGSRGRTTRRFHPNTYVRFRASFGMRPGSQVLSQNAPVLLTDKTQFSRPVRCLVKAACRLGRIDIMLCLVPIIRLIEGFTILKGPRVDHTIAAFLDRPGVLSLRLAPRGPGDRLEPWSDEGIPYSIASGCWIGPFARLIFV
jgi:hypothetical protein